MAVEGLFKVEIIGDQIELPAESVQLDMISLYGDREWQSHETRPGLEGVRVAGSPLSSMRVQWRIERTRLVLSCLDCRDGLH